MAKIRGLVHAISVLACVAFQGCAVAPVKSAGPIVPKELNMQPPNPQDPQPEASPIPEMVGATSAPFYIGAQPTQILLQMHAPTGPARLRDPRQREVILRVENVTCDQLAPSFRVYLNVPPGHAPEQDPQLRVGGLGLFGIVQASQRNRPHGGAGMSFRMDVTDVFNRLAAMPNWDPRGLRITFVAQVWDTPIPQVKVGRVSLYFK
jgi:hypothetical protein